MNPRKRELYFRKGERFARLNDQGEFSLVY